MKNGLNDQIEGHPMGGLLGLPDFIRLKGPNENGNA